MSEVIELADPKGLYTIFNEKLRKSSGSGANIAEEALKFLPGILRTLIGK